MMTGSTTPSMPETTTVMAAKVTAAGAVAATIAMTSMAEGRRRVAEIPRAEAKNLISLRTARHLHHPAREAEAVADAGDHAPPTAKEGSRIRMTKITTISTSVQSASPTGSTSSQFPERDQHE